MAPPRIKEFRVFHNVTSSRIWAKICRKRTVYSGLDDYIQKPRGRKSHDLNLLLFTTFDGSSQMHRDGSGALARSY